MVHADRSADTELHRFINCGKLSTRGNSYQIEANSEERDAVAKKLSLDYVDFIKAEFTLTPAKNGLILLSGRVEAKIRQACVISLSPMISILTLSIERSYSASGDPYRGLDSEPDEEGATARGTSIKDQPDPPELLENGGIDLGGVVCEELAVGIDPFPRLPDARSMVGDLFDVGQQGKKTENPFAVLEKLKKKLE